MNRIKFKEKERNKINKKNKNSKDKEKMHCEDSNKGKNYNKWKKIDIKETGYYNRKFIKLLINKYRKICSQQFTQMDLIIPLLSTYLSLCKMDLKSKN